MLLGVLLLVNPGAGAIGITWAIGWVAFLFGGLELWLASGVRHETHELTRQTRIHTVAARTGRELTRPVSSTPLVRGAA